MKNLQHNYLIIFLSCLCSPFLMNSQNLVWEYEVETPYRNTPRHFWVDKEGNGYYNMNRENPKNPTAQYRHYFLLSLDAQGKFKGANHVQECASSTDLLPFGDKYFVSSGNNCSGKYRYTRDTKVYNKKGKLVKTGKAFDGVYTAKVKEKTGYTFFSDKLGFEDFESMTIGHIDWDFNFSSHTISMESLEIDTLGIVNNFRDPARFKSGTWAIPFNYGKVKNGNQISIDHGIVVGIDKDKISWTYPQTINSFVLEQLSAHEDKLAIIMESKKEKTSLFVLLDQNGNTLLEKPISLRGIKDILLTDVSLIVLTKYGICIFDLEGNKLLDAQDYQEGNLVEQKQMARLENGDLIITGIRDNNSVFRRINFHEEEEEEEEEVLVEETIEEEQDVLEEEHEEVESPQIESAEIEEVAEEIFSVSVYPNPASLFINFDIEGGADPEYLIQIIDVTGKIIYTDSFRDTRYELILTDFTSGSYFYRIAQKNNPTAEVLSGKFIQAN